MDVSVLKFYLWKLIVEGMEVQLFYHVIFAVNELILLLMSTKQFFPVQTSWVFDSYWFSENSDGIVFM